ncbi:MAG TPA: sulfotransferase [Rhizomicrobium sp.]|jgi:tetratricopeptide (TPR) repeat protein|nr:sulfotransferase [Rhizomicrobium sp.]
MRIPFVTFTAKEAWPVSIVSPGRVPGSAHAPEFITQREAKRLVATDLSRAEALALQVLGAQPGEPQALCLLGEVMVRRERYAAARSILEPLVQSHPHMGDAWHALAIARRGLGERADAIADMTRALDLAWRNKDIWYELGDILSFDELGQDGPSGIFVDEAMLTEAGLLLRDHEYKAAETVLRTAHRKYPDNARLLKLLADAVLHNPEHWSDFKPILERCLVLAPDFTAARFRLATMLFSLGQSGLALPHIVKLAQAGHAEPLYRALTALALMRSGQPNSAVMEFDSFIDSCPHLPGLWLEYAKLLYAVGDPKAPAIFKEAIKLLPSHADAYLGLAQAKAYPIDDELMEHVRAQLARADIGLEDRAKLHFVLGRRLEDDCDYDDAFAQFKTCNDLLYEAKEFGIEVSDDYLARGEALFRPSFFARRSGTGHPEKGPIFIVGLPRSGSTLIEQILCSHPSIQPLGEIDCLPRIVRRALPELTNDPNTTYPFSLRHADAALLATIGREYMAAARNFSPDASFFTDKLPGNFIHVGLIHIALPHAKIIDARRHPLGCCLSYFQNYFPSDHPWRLKLRDVGRYYANYVELMALFDSLLPGKVHRVFYESLVADLEPEVRRLFDYLDLPFSDACLRFHENTRHVSTISADQVRKPLYAAATDHWRHYDRWLGPLKEELGCILEAYPDTPDFFPRVQARSRRSRNLGDNTTTYSLVIGTLHAPFL